MTMMLVCVVQHLIYSIVDVVVSELFPELNQPPQRPLPTHVQPRPLPV